MSQLDELYGGTTIVPAAHGANIACHGNLLKLPKSLTSQRVSL